MAKNDNSSGAFDVSEFLAGLPAFESVYDAKQVTNRPFTLNSITWKEFQPNERNNYRAGRKLEMHVTFMGTGKLAIIETTMKGIVVPVEAIEAHGYLPCNLMIAQDGKFLTIVAR